MIEYIPTENKFEVPEIPKVTGYQKQFSIVPPRGDVSENVSDTSPEPETPIEKIEEPIKDVVEEKIKKEPLSTSRGIITIDKNVAIGNMQKVLDKFSEAGINLRVTSGARKAGLFGKAGNKSHHVSGNAIDVVPGEGETWNSMKEKINNNEALKAWLRENKIGILDETNPTTMKKTGATGAHWHIGPDKAALADFELIFGKNGVKLPVLEQYKSGGKIYIKPENRGKFTRLKQRTGKSATWFKKHGTPAQKKMATFALNAKKWKHQEGGSLFNPIPLLISEKENYFRGIPYKAGKYSAAELLSNTGIPRIPADDYILNAPVNLDDYKDKQEYMESGFNSNAYNKYSKATGRFQITPIAHKEYTNRTGKTGDLNDPTYNEQVRDWYINEYLPSTQVVKEGNTYPMVQAAKILAAYNYGPGALNKKLTALQKSGIDTTSSLEWVNHLNPETSNYIKFILMGEDVGKKTNEEFERLKRK